MGVVSVEGFNKGDVEGFNSLRHPRLKMKSWEDYFEVLWVGEICNDV